MTSIVTDHLLIESICVLCRPHNHRPQFGESIEMNLELSTVSIMRPIFIERLLNY